MDVISILSGVKNKVLDAKNYELLKHAYDLQNENIEQLKSNNEALKESNQLILEKVKRLENENESLRQSVEHLKEQVSKYSDTFHASELSEVARAVLKLYVQEDATNMFGEDIIRAISYGRIAVEAALDELEKVGILITAGGVIGQGSCYFLTERGKKYLIQGAILTS